MNKVMLPDDPSSGHRVYGDVDRHPGLLALGGVCIGATLEGGHGHMVHSGLRIHGRVKYYRILLIEIK